MTSRLILTAVYLGLVISAASCTYDGPDAEQFFSGRPSPYARALNGVLNETDEDLAVFLRVPSHVDLYGWYAETYATDLNNVLKRRDADRLAGAYGMLTDAEKSALQPYLSSLEPEVSGKLGL